MYDLHDQACVCWVNLCCTDPAKHIIVRNTRSRLSRSWYVRYVWWHADVTVLGRVCGCYTLVSQRLRPKQTRFCLLSSFRRPPNPCVHAVDIVRVVAQRGTPNGTPYWSHPNARGAAACSNKFLSSHNMRSRSLSSNITRNMT